MMRAKECYFVNIYDFITIDDKLCIFRYILEARNSNLDKHLVHIYISVQSHPTNFDIKMNFLSRLT